MSEPQAENTSEPSEPHAFAEGEEAPPPGVRVMAVARWLLVLGMAALAGLSLLYVYRDADHAEQATASEYYCPMHPAVVQDHPGECPICNMSLVPREPAAKPATPAHTHAPAPSAQQVPDLKPIEIPAQRLQRIGMRTAQVVRQKLPAELKAVGYVAPSEAGLAVIQTRFSGWIEELHVAETGQLVQRGQLLARIYSPDLYSAQQELLNAQRWADAAPAGKLGAAPNLRESARSRLVLMGMQPAEIDEVEKTGTPHRLIEIRSPVRGYVAQKSAIQGLYVEPGTRLFDLADLSTVWVMVELFERDAARVKAGQRAQLTLTAYPGETFSGKVQLVYPTLEVATRTQRARIEFKNPDLRLRPGMFGDLVIQQGAGEGLTVPREAVVDSGERSYVFVSEGEGRFTPRVVQLGARFEDSVEVTSGLREGEIVVTTGNFLLDSESRLRTAVEGGR
jgi:multidrug efflux pump subunit AcrA (membrane-fusion protein)